MADPNETRQDKFNRLAISRTSKALKAIRVIENLKNYPHTQAQTDHITAALGTAVDKVAAALAGGKEAKAKDEFGFPEGSASADL